MIFILVRRVGGGTGNKARVREGSRGAIREVGKDASLFGHQYLICRGAAGSVVLASILFLVCLHAHNAHFGVKCPQRVICNLHGRPRARV